MRKTAALLLLLGLLSCTRYDILQMSDEKESKMFFAEFSTDADVKTYVDESLSMYWVADDRISVFCSPTNEQYRFTGVTGQDSGCFENLTAPVTPVFSSNYAVYPYDSDNACGGESSVSVTLPAVQQYAPSSFGVRANTMVAVSESIEDNVFKFKNACGFLMLKLYGGDRVKSIKLYGNNGEKIAGKAIISVSNESAPTVAMSGDATTIITLDCTEAGIRTNSSIDDFTPFWIVVPPVTFTSGFTMEVTNTDDDKIVRTTSKSVTIERNRIAKMAPVKVDAQNSNDLLSFSLSDGEHSYEAFDISGGYVNVQVPNGTDMTNLVASFNHNGASIIVNDVPQTSGADAHDFSDFVNPVTYVVTSKAGASQSYVIRMFDLPVVIVNTKDHTGITDKVNYKTCEIKLIDNEKTIDYSFEDDDANIKGRGNSTWNFPKKPYNIKLSKKVDVLGMPKHKKWCLLANYCDRTLLRNAFCHQIGRSASGFDWVVKGKYVELILNGEHKGNYYLCEKIEVDENRVNIDKNSGYLLEFDFYNDDYHFTSPLVSSSSGRNIYVKLKAPVESAEEDPGSTVLNTIKDYVLQLEDALTDGRERAYLPYIEVNSSVDYFLIQELVGNRDVRVASNYMSKDVNGKLVAGPLWDFDLYTLSNNYKGNHYATEALYYPFLLQDNYYKSVVKQRWLQMKEALLESDMESFCENLAISIHKSALRDELIWPVSGKTGAATFNGDNGLSIENSTKRMLNIYKEQLIWLDNYINSLVVDYDSLPGGNEDVDAQQDESGDFDFNF